MCKFVQLVVLGTLICLAPFTTSAESEANDTAEYESEVIVIGETPDYIARQRIYAAQDELYAIFNKLNDDKKFDITCETIALPNSRFERRTCLANYYRETMREEGQAYLAEIAPFYPYAVTPTMIYRGEDRRNYVTRHQKVLQKKFKDMATDNEEFRKALIKYVDLKNEYSKMNEE